MAHDAGQQGAGAGAVGGNVGNEVNQLQSLDELCQVNDPASEFLNSLNFIYSYPLHDVQSTLAKLSLETLKKLYNLLWDKMKVMFDVMRDCRPKPRRLKDTIISDIYYFGLSLAHGTLSKEIKKIYLNKSSTTAAAGPGAPPAPPESEMENMLRMLRGLEAKVSSLEKDLAAVKRENAGLQDQLDVIAKATAAPARNQPGRALDSSTNDGDHTEGETEQDHEAKTENPSVSSTQRDPQTCQDSHTADHQSDADKHDLYVGGVHKGSTVEDMETFLKAQGIHHASNITLLAAKDDWTSFKITLASREFDHALKINRWPTGIKVRPYRVRQWPSRPSLPRQPCHQYRDQRDQQLDRRCHRLLRPVDLFADSFRGGLLSAGQQPAPRLGPEHYNLEHRGVAGHSHPPLHGCYYC